MNLRLLWYYTSESLHYAAVSLAGVAFFFSSVIGLFLITTLVIEFERDSFFWWGVGTLSASIPASLAVFLAIARRFPVWAWATSLIYVIVAFIPAWLTLVHAFLILMFLVAAALQTVNWRGYPEPSPRPAA